MTLSTWKHIGWLQLDEWYIKYKKQKGELNYNLNIKQTDKYRWTTATLSWFAWSNILMDGFKVPGLKCLK